MRDDLMEARSTIANGTVGKASRVSNHRVDGIKDSPLPTGVVAFAMTMPGGCGEGYRIDPACLNVTDL
jgi:hypothetical protein